MATITSTSSGNFSSGATWVGGVVPGAADVAVAANGHTVAIDTDITVISFQQAGTGKFTLGNGRNVTGNVIANAGTITSGGTLEVTCGSSESATLNGNATGTSSTSSNIAGIVISGVGTFTLNGSVTSPNSGSLGAIELSHAVIYTNVTCTLNINGSVSAGPNYKQGVWARTSSNATINVVGNITGGPGTDANAIWHQGEFGVVNATSETITSSGINGGTRCYGIRSDGANGLVTVAAVTIQGGTSSAGSAISARGADGVINVTATTVTAGTGGSASAISHFGTSGTTQVTATTIQATSGTNCHGIESAGALASVVTTGTVSAVGASSHGIISASTSSSGGVSHTGNLIDSTSGRVAIRTTYLRVSAGTGTTTLCTPGSPTGSANPKFSPDQVLGVPAKSDVRAGVVYASPATLIGTLAVPAPESVSYGVLTDNTVGSAALDLSALAEVIGNQIAAAMDSVP